MKNLLKQHFWVSLIVVVVVLLSIYVGLSSLFGQKPKPPAAVEIEKIARVRRVEPLSNTKQISPAPDIVLYFDVEVKAEKFSLKSEPIAEFERKQIDKDKIRFRPKESLAPNQEYLITLEALGEPKFNWKFTTKNFFVEKDYAAKVNKAKDALPYKSADVKVSYDAPTDKYYADISGQPMSKYLEEVQRWFATFGITDTSPLNIVAFPVNKF